jgi:hypothetical protein
VRVASASKHLQDRALVALQDAGRTIMKLPNLGQNLPE